MPRIKPVTQPEGKASELLGEVQKHFGGTPNIFTTMAQAPAVLQGYLALSHSLNSVSLLPKLREQIALAVAGANGCHYCASAHALLGKKAGISETEVGKNLEGTSDDPKTKEILQFVRCVVQNRGQVSDSDFQKVQSAGLSDIQIIEVVAVIVANIFTNYFNNVVQTEVDFPQVNVPLGAHR